MGITRKEQKAETRRKLLEATMDQLSTGRSFDSLSLREVARAADIAPTSFYRHFHDMEELGLALIEEGGETLRQLMLDVRRTSAGATSVTRSSVETLYAYFKENPGLFRMLLQERLLGKPIYRKATTKLFERLIRDLASYLDKTSEQRNMPIQQSVVVAEAMVALLCSEGIAMLDQSQARVARQKDVTITQLKMILLGAEALAKESQT